MRTRSDIEEVRQTVPQQYEAWRFRRDSARGRVVSFRVGANGGHHYGHRLYRSSSLSIKDSIKTQLSFHITHFVTFARTGRLAQVVSPKRPSRSLAYQTRAFEMMIFISHPPSVCPLYGLWTFGIIIKRGHRYVRRNKAFNPSYHSKQYNQHRYQMRSARLALKSCHHAYASKAKSCWSFLSRFMLTILFWKQGLRRYLTNLMSSAKRRCVVYGRRERGLRDNHDNSRKYS